MSFLSSLRKFILGNEARSLSPHYRIAVIGGKQTGKTSLISQFTGKVLPEKETHYNIDREVLKTGGTKLTLDIVDTSGVYNCGGMLQVCISRSDAFILVYSTDDKESFDRMQRMRKQIIDVKMDKDVPIVVVGTKVDLPERAVSLESAEYLIRQIWQHEYIEVTSSSYDDVCGVFEKLVKQLVPGIPLSSALQKRRRSAPSAFNLDRRRRSSVMDVLRNITKKGNV